MPSAVQKFFLAIMPRWMSKAMEKESRLWMLQCGHCSREVSIWDLGGIRYLACGITWRWIRCPQCDRRTCHKVYKKK